MYEPVKTHLNKQQELDIREMELLFRNMDVWLAKITCGNLPHEVGALRGTCEAWVQIINRDFSEVLKVKARNHREL